MVLQPRCLVRLAGASAGTLTDVNAGGERFHGYAYSAGPVDTGPDTDQGVCITPTGEYIIRDGIYINGCWVLVGSYRAYISTNDAGTGPTLTGYAWDGFWGSKSAPDECRPSSSQL